MGGYFGYENKFFRIAGKVVDGFYVSVLWLLFSIPIVTLHTASVALYYTVHKSLHGDRGYIWQNFWGAFKSNFKQTTKIWLVMLCTLAFLFADYRITYIAVEQGMPFRFLCYVFLFFMFFWAAWDIVLFAYSARFENSMKDTMKNAAVIALLHLPWSLLMIVLLLAVLLAIYLVPPAVLLLPAGFVYVCEMILERIFCKYMSPEDLKKEERLTESGRV